ncbi:MAG: IS110 family transposase [Deltaproteobacteria bacterium]|nr:IS110 family transposase [Deltaproteobacteria bacterium]
MKYLGVDVARDSLEVADVLGSQGRAFSNTQAGIQGLLRWLSRSFPEEDLQLVVEPTSTYHHPLIHALVARQFAYTLINPAHTSAFARVQGKRAKTDRVDARLLASLGESQQPEPSSPPEETQEGLKALRRHVEWLEKELQAARNRLDTASFSPWTPQTVLDSLERTIQQLEKEAQQVREAMATQQQQHPEWTRQVNLLTSIPGVGERTATLLLTEMPPVASCPSARSWVAFCGLNPEPRQSGKGHYSRLSRVGTARVRAGLYLPAVSALRWNPAVRALGDRLRQRGKMGRVRIVAAMHKLLRLCFGVLKSGRPFDYSLHQATLPT